MSEMALKTLRSLTEVCNPTRGYVTSEATAKKYMKKEISVLVMPYGKIDLGQHWLRYWLVAWQYQPITLINVNLIVRSRDIHLRAILQDISQPSSKNKLWNSRIWNFIQISKVPKSLCPCEYFRANYSSILEQKFIALKIDQDFSPKWVAWNLAFAVPHILNMKYMGVTRNECVPHVWVTSCHMEVPQNL